MLCAASLAFSARSAAAAEPAGEMVSYKAGGETVRAYLARPEEEDRGTPGVVVIHEWWGLNDQIKGVADRLARDGYLAIAPDLYRGKLAADRGLAHELMRGLSENRAVDLIKGAADHLRSLGGGNHRRVGTVGFCMGGRLSLAAALKGAEVQATVMFYGSVETTRETVEPLRAPLLGIFGREDRGIPVEDVKKFEEALKAAGKVAAIQIYPGVGHAFFNEQGPSYDRQFAVDAWARTQAFFAKHLKPKPAPEEQGS
jgi:carboxymethylenebutenolidase